MSLWFWLMCAYGLAWAVVFTVKGEFKGKTLVHLIYAGCLAPLGLFMSQDAFKGLAAASGPAKAWAFVSGTSLWLISLMCNAVPIYLTLLHFVGTLGRSLAGLSQIVYTKTYDKASGAEARGDYALAAELYRSELERDPQDRQALRRLAEVLVKAGRLEEAVAELRRLTEMADSQQERHNVAFRLAELLAEHLGRPAEAEQLYHLIVTEAPHSKQAQYAQARLAARGGDKAAAESPKEPVP